MGIRGRYGVGGMKSWDKEGRRRGGAGDASLASSSRHSTFYIATAALEDRCGCHASALWARIGHGSRWHAEGGCLGLRTTHRISGKGHRCTIDLLGRSRGPAAAEGGERMGWDFGPKLDAAGIWHINGGVEKGPCQHPRVPNVPSAVRRRSCTKVICDAARLRRFICQCVGLPRSSPKPRPVKHDGSRTRPTSLDGGMQGIAYR